MPSILEQLKASQSGSVPTPTVASQVMATEKAKASTDSVMNPFKSYVEKMKKIVSDVKAGKFKGQGDYGVTQLGQLQPGGIKAPQTSTTSQQFEAQAKLNAAFGTDVQKKLGEMNPSGATGFAYDAFGRPAIQLALQPLGLASDAYQIYKGAKTPQPLIDSKLTGQVGGMKPWQMAGLGAENLSNLLGGGFLDDASKAVAKGAYKGLTRTLGKEGAVVGALGGGGYAAEQKEATPTSIGLSTVLGGVLGTLIGGLSGRLAQRGISKASQEILSNLPEEITKLAKENNLTKEIEMTVKDSLTQVQKLEQKTGKALTQEEKAVIIDKAMKSNLNIQKALPAPEKKAASLTDQFLKDSVGAKKSKGVIEGIVDQRIPSTPIRTTERALLVSKFKNLSKGARMGYAGAKADIQSLKKSAETFIKEAIPDNGLTAGEAKRLLSSLANVVDEKQLDTFQNQALEIAERSIRRDLIDETKTFVKEVFEKQPKLTGRMILNAANEGDQVVSSAGFAIATKQRNQVKMLSNFFNLKQANEQIKNYRTVDSFLKENPEFNILSEGMINTLLGKNTKAPRDFSAEELGKLNLLVQSLVERGKAQTRLNAAARGMNVERQIEAMKSTATKVSDLSENETIAYAQEVAKDYWTPQTWLDAMDGFKKAKTQMKEEGMVSKTIGRPLDEAIGKYEREKIDMGKEFINFYKSLKGGLQKGSDKRIAIYAMSKQPKARAWLVDTLGEDAEKIINSIQLNDAEYQLYNKMRDDLQGMWSRVNGTKMSLASDGQALGYEEAFFPMRRDYDSFDSVNQAISEPISKQSLQRDYGSVKKTTGFGSLKSRTGKADPLAKLDLSAVKNYLTYMDKAMYYTNLEPAIENVRLITQHPEFEKMIGSEGMRFFNGTRANGYKDSYIARLARQGRKENMGHPMAEKVMRGLKRNLTVAFLSNMKSALTQLSTLPVAASYIGPERLTEGIAMMTQKKWRDFARAKSDQLFLRSGGDVDLFEPSKSIIEIGEETLMGRLGKYDEAIKNKLLDVSIKYSDAMAAMGTWLGAYKKGLALKGSEEEAIRYAEDIVLRTQGSGHFKDIARAQNVSTFRNMLMPFSTFINTQWQVIRQDLLKGTVLNAKEKEILASAKSAGLLLGLMAAWTYEGSLDYMFQDPKYREDDVAKGVAENVGINMLGSIPAVGPFLSGYKFRSGGTYAPLGVSEAQDVAYGLADAVTDLTEGDSPWDSLWTATKGASNLTGYGSGIITKHKNLYENTKDIMQLGEVPAQGNFQLPSTYSPLGSGGNFQLPNKYLGQ